MSSATFVKLPQQQPSPFPNLSVNNGTCTWKKISPQGSSPASRCNHAVVNLNEKLLVVVGGRGRGKDQRYNDVHAFNLESNRWLPVVEMGLAPVPCSSCSLNEVGGIIYFYGGKTTFNDENGMFTLTIEELKGQSKLGNPTSASSNASDEGLVAMWHQTKTLNSEYEAPRGCFLHASCVVDNKIYFFGGQVDESSCQNDLYIFSTRDHSWIQANVVGERPKGRTRHSMVSCGFKLFVFGGMDVADNIFDDLWMLDTRQQPMRWERIEAESHLKNTNNPPPLSGHTACSSGSRMIVFGGLTDIYNKTGESINATYVFDTITMKWSVLSVSDTFGFLPDPRNGHRAALYRLPAQPTTTSSSTNTQSLNLDQEGGASESLVVFGGWKKKYLGDLIVLDTGIKDGVFTRENYSPTLFARQMHSSSSKRMFPEDILFTFQH